MPSNPSFSDDIAEAIWTIAKEGNCPKVGAKSFEGRFTLVDVPADRDVMLRGHAVRVPMTTYLLIENSYGSCGIFASNARDARAYFNRFAVSHAMHKGEIPAPDGRIRKRPGAEPRPEVAEERPQLRPRVWAQPRRG